MISLFHPFYALLTALTLHGAAYACTGHQRKLINPSKNEGNVIQRMVGNDIQLSEYVGSGAGPVYSGEELRCTLDQTCCWKNGPGEISWMKSSGTPENEKMQNSFGTNDGPNGDFLVASSEGARSNTHKAQFISCQISCTVGDITIMARHWATKGVTLEACVLDGDTNGRRTCKSWPGSNGYPDTITLPGGGKNLQLAIEASGFTSQTGSVAMLDDIAVTFQTCSSAVTSGPPQSLHTEPPKSLKTPAVSVGHACTKIVCNFEQNNPCSYSDARSAGVDAAGGGVNVPWKVENAPFENKLTGISKAAEGARFAGAYLKPGDKAALVTDVNYPTDYVIRLNGYRATEGINLFGCCNDVFVCPFSTTEQVQASDYRIWKTASITCPSNTKKIIFYAVNNGRNQGAVGLDNIQLLVPSSTSPDKATQSAC